MGDGFLSIFKTKAIVIKSMDLKESDKLLWLFTEKLGKVSAVARGARKSKSKLLPLSLPFCFGEFVLFRGKSMYSINEGEISNSFQSLLNDFESLTYASYLCELIDIALVEEESNRELFKEFISAFYLLQNNAVDFKLLISAFEIKLIIESGYYFNLDKCVYCGDKITSSNSFNIQYLGGICTKCERHQGIKISFASFNALRYLVKTPLANIYKLNLAKEVIEELHNLLINAIYYNFGKKPHSLEMLNIFRGVEKNE
ncbi:DNA repair protein RecO [Candidatus Clostridium radicumherbarum]|uniref:DNA repair protein RecO n=1 Tax=Candidatus Clostridium radicumherbarum TaxID=3381662 RepID=A0ABW8TRS0_9CLOT